MIAVAKPTSALSADMPHEVYVVLAQLKNGGDVLIIGAHFDREEARERVNRIRAKHADFNATYRVAQFPELGRGGAA